MSLPLMLQPMDQGARLWFGCTGAHCSSVLAVFQVMMALPSQRIYPEVVYLQTEILTSTQISRCCRCYIELQDKWLAVKWLVVE
jgi:hypothetical protein